MADPMTPAPRITILAKSLSSWSKTLFDNLVEDGKMSVFWTNLHGLRPLQLKPFADSDAHFPVSRSVADGGLRHGLFSLPHTERFSADQSWLAGQRPGTRPAFADELLGINMNNYSNDINCLKLSCRCNFIRQWSGGQHAVIYTNLTAI